MASQNDAQYYDDDANFGNYQYEKLEDLVNFFMLNYCGDNTILGPTPRRQVLGWMKKAIQQLSFNTLNEVRAVELELGDNLDIILTPDYVDYVRISWLDTVTGQFRPMSENTRANTVATSYLQDHLAKILFDDDGFILQGTSASETINNNLIDNTSISETCREYCLATEDIAQQWGMRTDRNYNGTFNIDKRAGRIHFSSENAPRIIILEYVSDGLQYLDEDDIKVHKKAEMALYAFVKWNLLNVKMGVNAYDKRDAKHEYYTLKKNAGIALSGMRIAATTQMLKQQNSWLK